MAAAPFGFSVGDSIAGIQLIHKATKALRAASGATAQFQQAILDLELMATVLRRVQGLTPATASDETIRTVQYCGAVCHAPLGSFLQRIKRLEPCLDFEHRSDKSRLDKAISGGRKLQWALSLEEEVAKLKASIGTGIGILNTLLEVESLERGELMQKDIQRVIGQTERVLPAMDEMLRFLQSNVATQKQAHGLQRGLEHLENILRQTATTQQAQNLVTASADLSVQIEKTATKHQTDNLVKLMEDVKQDQHSERVTLLSLSRSSIHELSELRQITKDSNLMLMSLMKRTPTRTDFSGRALQDATQLQSSLANTPSQITIAFDITHIINLLKALRGGLNAILAMLLWLTPAFRIWLRALTTIARPPTQLLDSNITLTDALN